MKKLLCLRKVREEVREILHLPLCQRIMHRNARRTLSVISAGTGLMILGSTIAANRHELAELIPIHHILFDVGGYFLHAVGALPALRYVEPLITLLLGASE